MMINTGGNGRAHFVAVHDESHPQGVCEPDGLRYGAHVDAVAAWIPEAGPISFGTAGASVADVWLAEHWAAIRQAAQDLGTVPDPEALPSSRLATTAEHFAAALISDLNPVQARGRG